MTGPPHHTLLRTVGDISIQQRTLQIRYTRQCDPLRTCRGHFLDKNKAVCKRRLLETPGLGPQAAGSERQGQQAGLCERCLPPVKRDENDSKNIQQSYSNFPKSEVYLI